MSSTILGTLDFIPLISIVFEAIDQRSLCIKGLFRSTIDSLGQSHLITVVDSIGSDDGRILVNRKFEVKLLFSTSSNP